MNFKEYQRRASETAIYPGITVDGNEDLPYGGCVSYLYPAMGLSGEVGEVAELLKKAVRDHAGHIDHERKAKLEKELGDVLWYVAELATALGLDLGEIAHLNIAKLASRKARGVIQGSGDER